MTTTRIPRTTRPTRAVRRVGLLAAALVCTAALAAGCTASRGGDASFSEAADVDSGVQSGADSMEGSATTQDGAAAPDALALAPAVAESARQVVQTGALRLTVDEPPAAADTVVRLAEGAGGRVDARTEEAPTDRRAGSAVLTIRIPSAKVTQTVDDLRELGTLESMDLDAQDVTAAAQDLDARIRGLQLSVARMEDLLARTTTTTDIVSAENALAERQTRLEELQSQRARLADAVALSTLTVELYGPGIVPAAVEPGPTSFLGGLAVGWGSFVATVQTVVVVLGVLLPWLAFAGAVGAGVVAVTRSRRRRRAETRPTPPTAPPAPPASQPAADPTA